MASFLKYINRDAAPYHVKTQYGRPEAKARACFTSRTVYVGNLAFVTTDVMLYALFSRCGSVDRVIMGINRETRQPCGFAFVIFMERAPTLAAVATLHGTVLDERVIKVELDKGFHEGKQYGRGVTGGQVRDELRGDYDEGRGGYGLGGASEGSSMYSPSSYHHQQRGGGGGGGGGGGWRGGGGMGGAGRGGGGRGGRGGWRGRGGGVGAGHYSGMMEEGGGRGGGGGGGGGWAGGGGGKKRGRDDREEWSGEKRGTWQDGGEASSSSGAAAAVEEDTNARDERGGRGGEAYE